MSGVLVVPVSAADINYSVSSAIGATGETVKVIGIDDKCGLIFEYPDKSIKIKIISKPQ